MTHQCSAWRNTDSMLASPRGKFKFGIGFGHLPFHFEEPIILKLLTTHIPASILHDPAVHRIQNTLRAVGAVPNLPLYLLPGFERDFHASDLTPKLFVTHGLRLEESSPGDWRVFPDRDAETVSLEITGEVPASAKAGDVVLVNVTAQYPAAGRNPARRVGFLEFIHITDKRVER
jgi:hypothetical protein